VKISEILAQTAARLERGGIESARAEAEWIISDLLGFSRTELFLHAVDEFPGNHASQMEDIVLARLHGRPLQYLMGYTEFYGRRLACDPRALIPRPETEILVEVALSHLNEKFPPREGLRPLVWDIGTGCGNIAVTLAAERPDLWVLASDIQKPALRLAQENIESHRVEGRISLLDCSLFEAVAPGHRFAAICSNPPYVSERAENTLPREVRDFEPCCALFAQGDGLAILRKIISTAKEHLQNGGLLALEIGYDQAGSIRELFAREHEYIGVKLVKDLAGYERVAIGIRR